MAWCFFSPLARGQFTTILNIPPDPDIGFNQSIGSGTQLILGEGGVIGNSFTAGDPSGSSTNVEVNISGGSVGNHFDAFGGSVVNVSGGSISIAFDAYGGSTVNISGGSFDSGLEAKDGSNINISGGDIGYFFKARGSLINLSGGTMGDRFNIYSSSTLAIAGGEYRLDGALINELVSPGSSLAFDLPSGSLLSGTLSDGTPFAFFNFDPGNREGDRIRNGSLTLNAVAMPAIGPPLVTLPGNSAPLGIRAGQILVVENGGAVTRNFNAGWGSTVTISGGQVGDNFEAVGAQVNVSSGSIGDHFDAFSGTTVNLTGGSIGEVFDANSNSTVNVSGGSVGQLFHSRAGSTVSISGGSIGRGFTARSSSTVRISGGSFGRGFATRSGSAVNLSGGDFRLDGVPVAGLDAIGNSQPINVPSGSLLSGTLADGTPFALLDQINFDFVTENTLTLTNAALPAVGPELLSTPGDPVPLGIRDGQTLVVNDGGNLGDNFNMGFGSKLILRGGQVGRNVEAVGSEVTISGGSVESFKAFDNTIVSITGGTVGFGPTVHSGSILNMSGGTLGQGLDVFGLSTVNISGGSIGDRFSAFGGSVINVSGGEIGNIFEAENGSTINISGGTVGDFFDAENGSLVNVSGGTVGEDFNAFAGSQINFFGTEFILNGIDITSSLNANSPFIIADRDVTLSGFLADGSAFSFDLISSDSFEIQDYFDTDALLTVTLVGPGDFNGDGKVDGSDFLKWQRGESPVSLGAQDLADWQANYGSSTLSPASSVTVPEPSTVILGLLASFLGISLKHRL